MQAFIWRVLPESLDKQSYEGREASTKCFHEKLTAEGSTDAVPLGRLERLWTHLYTPCREEQHRHLGTKSCPSLVEGSESLAWLATLHRAHPTIREHVKSRQTQEEASTQERSVGVRL